MWEHNLDINERFETGFEIRRLGIVIDACLNAGAYNNESANDERTEATQAYYTSTSVLEMWDRIKERTTAAMEAEGPRPHDDVVMYVVQLLSRELEQTATTRSLIERMPEGILGDYCRSALQEGAYQLGVGATPTWERR